MERSYEVYENRCLELIIDLIWKGVEIYLG